MTNGCLRATVSPAILIFSAIRQQHARLSVLNPASVRSACATHRPMLHNTSSHTRSTLDSLSRLFSPLALSLLLTLLLAPSLSLTLLLALLFAAHSNSLLSAPSSRSPLSHSPRRSCFQPAPLRVPDLLSSPATRCNRSFRWRKSAGG